MKRLKVCWCTSTSRSIGLEKVASYSCKGDYRIAWTSSFQIPICRACLLGALAELPSPGSFLGRRFHWPGGWMELPSLQAACQAATKQPRSARTPQCHPVLGSSKRYPIIFYTLERLLQIMVYEAAPLLNYCSKIVQLIYLCVLQNRTIMGRGRSTVCHCKHLDRRELIYHHPLCMLLPSLN